VLLENQTKKRSPEKLNNISNISWSKNLPTMKKSLNKAIFNEKAVLKNMKVENFQKYMTSKARKKE
jgi:hypothetical protein